MSERKYKEKEIVKALTVCISGDSCKECPINPNHGNYGYCTSLAIAYALDLINRQKAAIEKLQEVNADLNESLRLAAEANKDLKAEIERLADRSHKCIYLSDEESMEYCVDGPCPHYEAKAKVKAEAIKEFELRLKEKSGCIVARRDGVELYTTKLYQIRATDIDSLVAEMTEGK